MKKRVIWGIIAALLLQCVTFGTYVFADEIPITIWINGEKVESEVDPVTENDRTLVPLRAIFEAMGAEVSWDDASQTAKVAADGITIQVVIDDVVMKKNGEDVILDVPARLINDRTMVPVRAISEGIGADVDWNEEEQKVLITYQKQEDEKADEPYDTMKVIGRRVQQHEIEGYKVVWYESVDTVRLPIKDVDGNVVAYETKNMDGELIGVAVHPFTGEEIAISSYVFPNKVNLNLTKEDEEKLKKKLQLIKNHFTVQLFIDIFDNHSAFCMAVKSNASEAINCFIEKSWDTAFNETLKKIQQESSFAYNIEVENEAELFAYYKRLQRNAKLEAFDVMNVLRRDLNYEKPHFVIEFLDEAKNQGDIRFILFYAIERYGDRIDIDYFLLQNTDKKYLIREITDISVNDYFFCTDEMLSFEETVQYILFKGINPSRIYSIFDVNKENDLLMEVDEN